MSRRIQTIEDAERAINELLIFKEQLFSNGLNLKGKRVVNAGQSVDQSDYVTKSELVIPKIPTFTHKDQFYTAVFTNDGTVTTGQEIDSYVVGRGREGTPVQVWLRANGPPNGADLVVNINYNFDTVDHMLLSEDLILPDGEKGPVMSFNVVTPMPQFGSLYYFKPVIVSGGTASLVSIGVVIQRILGT